MKNHLLFLLLLLFVAGCREAVKPELSPTSVPTPESSAVYVYGQNKNTNDLVLKVGGEPVTVAAGYIKLAGTVLGEEPLAVLEIGGRGQVCRVGEEVSDYQVISISEREVKLCLKKRSCS